MKKRVSKTIKKTSYFSIDIKGYNRYNSRPQIVQAIMCVLVPLAQLVEHFTFNEGVDGSNPSRDTIFLHCSVAPSSNG